MGTMKLYNDLVRHTCTPMYNFYSNLFDLTGMSDVYNSISEQIFHHLESNITNRRIYLRFNKLASSVCDSVILVALREANFDLASRVVNFCAAQKHIMPG